MSTHRRLGIDIGRVIIGTAALGGESDTAFLTDTEEGALLTSPAEGAFESIARLVDAFDGQVWLVSKCGERIRERSKRWLAHQDFFTKTGLPEENLRFCRKRHEKRGHAEELGLGYFVDDRVGVLKHLIDVVPRLYLFGHQKPGVELKGTTAVLNWDEAEKTILRDLRRDEIRSARGEPSAS